MDSERRHELETNDLREFLDNFKDFWDKHGNQLLIALIVVMGAWVGYTQYTKYQADQAEAAYTDLNDADSADAFRTVAGDHAKVHDEAMRRGADTALGDARLALIEGDDGGAEISLKSARAAYTALAERGRTTEYQLAGLEGLAKVALMFKEWGDATAQYEAIIELAGDTFVNQADRAQRALERIDLLKDPVAFSPPEEVEPFEFPTPGDQPADPEPLPELPALPVPAGE